MEYYSAIKINELWTHSKWIQIHYTKWNISVTHGHRLYDSMALWKEQVLEQRTDKWFPGVMGGERV